MSIKDLLSLEKMLTPQFIQFFYKIGLVGVLLLGISQLIGGEIIAGLMTILLGFLAVRVISEIVIVYFKSNDVVVSMEDLDYGSFQEKFNEAKNSTKDKFQKVKGNAEENAEATVKTETASKEETK